VLNTPFPATPVVLELFEVLATATTRLAWAEPHAASPITATVSNLLKLPKNLFMSNFLEKGGLSRPVTKPPCDAKIDTLLRIYDASEVSADSVNVLF
jgi:hypothetical protein